ncbi:Amiloride-sensitive sodium channel [Nesidiocoris tenuis]|uniref:Amiloride-sensitive sodium channel n=1 Tax=Nesidiocoris tenuis TaxID=355587 RepID=A0ABN7AZ75_9HEMI|nr:Amiloride-sensitive sodium channel [Nesidiocoris tenuis]
MGKAAEFLAKTTAIFRNFFGQTSLHGLRFIAEEERHWSERLLWMFLCTISWIGFGIMLQKSYLAFEENSVSFAVETTGLSTDTSLPSVSVCEHEHTKVLKKTAKEIFGKHRDPNLDEVLRELIYFKGTAYYMREICNKDGIECPRGNYLQLAQRARVKCEEFFYHCTNYNDVFECCKHFVPVQTEVGLCYTFSAQYEKKLKEQGDPKWIDMTPKARKPLPAIGFAINGSAKVYLHSEYEVPYLNSLSSDVLNSELHLFKDYWVATNEVENQPEVRGLSLYQRKCRFPDENYIESADFYSYSSCIVDCRRRAQMKLCNCTSHHMPKTKPEEHCDYDGIICLDRYNSYLSTPSRNSDRKDGLVCDCLPGCVDLDFQVVDFRIVDILGVPDRSLIDSMMQIRLRSVPTEKYKRTVVNGKLDLVVSIGGAAGLFLGASLLTAVEVSLFFLIKARASEQQGGTKDNSNEVNE